MDKYTHNLRLYEYKMHNYNAKVVDYLRFVEIILFVFFIKIVFFKRFSSLLHTSNR